MSVYLEAVAQAAERRANSEAEFRAALVRATEFHSLSAIAPAAGLTKAGVAYLVAQSGGAIK